MAGAGGAGAAGSGDAAGAPAAAAMLPSFFGPSPRPISDAAVIFPVGGKFLSVWNCFRASAESLSQTPFGSDLR